MKRRVIVVRAPLTAREGRRVVSAIALAPRRSVASGRAPIAPYMPLAEDVARLVRGKTSFPHELWGEVLL